MGHCRPDVDLALARTSVINRIVILAFNTHALSLSLAIDVPSRVPTFCNIPPPRCATVQRAESIVVERIHNSSETLNLRGYDAGDLTGMALWLCTSKANTTTSPLLTSFRVEVDPHYGPYQHCKMQQCDGTYGARTVVGRSTACGASSSPYFATWYSFPYSALCAPNATLGTDNCTYVAPTVLKTIDLACVLADTRFAAACAQYNFAGVGQIISDSLASCPNATIY